MRQLLVLIVGYFITWSAYSCSTVPVYAAHTGLNKTASDYQYDVNKRTALQVKKSRQQREKLMKKRKKSNLADKKIPI